MKLQHKTKWTVYNPATGYVYYRFNNKEEAIVAALEISTNVAIRPPVFN